MNPSTRIGAKKSLKHPFIKKNNKRIKLKKKDAANVLNNLENFKPDNKFQLASWVFLVNQFSSSEENEKMEKMFKALDVNHDGSLSKKELLHGFSKTLGKEKARLKVE